MAKSGRKRRIGAARYPGGRIVHAERKSAETADDVTFSARASRRRKHPDLAPKTLEEEAFVGYELGRLFLRRVLDERQRKAGEAWARCVTDYARLMGYPAPTPRSVWLDEARGRACVPDPDPHRVLAVRRAYAEAFRDLSEAGATILERRYVLTACREVCIRDVETRDWPHHMIDALKRGLNRLAIRFGI